jgi:hypothetical protein
LSHDAAEQLIHRPEHQQHHKQQQQQQRCNGLVTSSLNGLVNYDVIGGDVCMGDHKPVFLSFKLRLGSSLFKAPAGDEIFKTLKSCDVTEREMPPSIESPSYTDLLDGNLYSKYIELRDNTASSLKMFKETTV